MSQFIKIADNLYNIDRIIAITFSQDEDDKTLYKAKIEMFDATYNVKKLKSTVVQML